MEIPEQTLIELIELIEKPYIQEITEMLTEAIFGDQDDNWAKISNVD